MIKMTAFKAIAALFFVAALPGGNAQAATFQSTFTTLTQMVIGADRLGTFPNTFELTNSTGVTWKSFVFTTSPPGANILPGSYSGPAGSFASIDIGFLAVTATIGGIEIANGGTLIFDLTTSSPNFSKEYFGEPSASAVAPIPLPAAAWLLLGGLGALGLTGRKRRSA